MLFIIECLERNMLPCFYKTYLGIECPACGMQRSFVALLKGNITESIQIYPALFPTLFLIVFLVLHLIFKFEKGAFILKISFIFTISIMILHFIIKIINQ
ncbi:MAG TPA: DUF2752 domain-containing protein [Bacteroidales bacterium]|nr:DUF2752 domain-containing protein [Bacteroidales bacterium]HQH19180.1 DUF2752 domain-containing protein [Bacteroidales bacterium]HQI45761.1 DUF2752 domain-containing protein [Bacteroidales bacterium]